MKVQVYLETERTIMRELTDTKEFFMSLENKKQENPNR